MSSCGTMSKKDLLNSQSWLRHGAGEDGEDEEKQNSSESESETMAEDSVGCCLFVHDVILYKHEHSWLR